MSLIIFTSDSGVQCFCLMNAYKLSKLSEMIYLNSYHAIVKLILLSMYNLTTSCSILRSLRLK